MNNIQPRTALYALAYGLFIWFEATLSIRWFADWIFIPGNSSATFALFALTPALVYAFGWFFYRMFATPRDERAAAAILICAVGLIADAAALGWNDMVFPDLDFDQQRLLASWIAWAYGTGLISGLWPRKLPLLPQA